MLNVKEKMSTAEGIMALMEILGEAPVKEVEQEVIAKAVSPAIKVDKQEPAAKEYVYMHGEMVEVGGKKVAKGYVAKRKGGANGSRNDAGKDKLKDIYVAAFAGVEAFNHSSEGFILRLVEADYAVKVSKAKTPKFDPKAEDFEVEKDFTVRGKAKNSAPKIAKDILAALEKEVPGMELISARASGIVLHMDGGEYTIKIAKKRDRVGFEAEKGAAYEK